MERINMLLQKISGIVENGSKNTAIDIDLAMDYTRVLYADLIEIRDKLTFNVQPAKEPTLAELTEAMRSEHEKNHVIEQPIVKEARPASVPVIPVTQTLKFSPKTDIRSFIGINDKYQFISELFGNDKEGYERMLDDIDNAGNEQIARNVLRSHVPFVIGNEDNETIALFYNLLNKFFSTT